MEGEGRSSASIQRLIDTGYEYNYPRHRNCTALRSWLHILEGVSSMLEHWLYANPLLLT